MVTKQEIDIKNVRNLEPGNYQALYRIGVFGRRLPLPHKIRKMTITKTDIEGRNMTVDFTINNPPIAISLAWYMWLIIAFLSYFGFRATLEKLYIIKPGPLTPESLISEGLTILIIGILYMLFLRKFLKGLP